MRRGRPFVLLGLFVAISVATRALFLRVPIVDLDESSYIVAAWEMLRGRALYTGVADHKPPLVYVYYAAVQALLGHGMVPVRLFTMVIVLPFTALGLAAFYRYSRAGALAGAAYLLYGVSFVGHDMLAVNCEILLLLPAVWALVLVRSPEASRQVARLAAAGVLLGLATLFKHQAALWLPVPLLAAWTAEAERETRAVVRRGAAVLAGFVAPLAACTLYFAGRGSLRDFVYWNVVHNLRYAANPIQAREAALRAALNVVPFLAVTAPLWWLSWKTRNAFPSLHERRVVAVALALAVCSALIGFRFYPHYFVLALAPLALAAAPGAAARLAPRVTAAGRVVVVWTAAMTAGWTAANAMIYARTDVQEETRPVFRDVAARIRADSCEAGASLFVWGYAPMFYYATEMPMASRFLFLESTLVGYVPGNVGSAQGTVATSRLIRPEHWDWLLDDLARTRPAYIVDTATDHLHRWNRFPMRAYPRLWALVGRDYEPFAVVDEVTLYRRRGCACAESAAAGAGAAAQAPVSPQISP